MRPFVQNLLKIYVTSCNSYLSNSRHYINSDNLFKSSATISARYIGNTTNNQSTATNMIDFTAPVSIMFGRKKQGKLPQINDQLLMIPAHKLSKMIKDGSLPSVRLCELYIERIKQIQPHVNGMAQDRFKEALDDARRIDELLASFRSGKGESEFTPDELEMLNSPLMGIPVTIKESIMVKGMRNSCGLWSRKNFIAQDDAVVVKNVQRYGMIPICTTNIPECTLYWADCQNKVYGRSINPYDLSRITGASSGGEGALIGGGASIIGVGSDMAGSLRIPAHYCGIYSHKPSPFLLSTVGNYPEIKESRMRMFSLGPMSRYATDLRHLFKCLLSDKDNSHQDTYYKFQPENITSIRREIIQKLDNPHAHDLSNVKFYYFNFNEASQLKGKQSVHVHPEFMEAQQEILDHFSSKFNCQIEHINLDKYLKKALIAWQCLLTCAGTIDRDQDYHKDELREVFGIDNWLAEFIKLPLGLSKHTKESFLTLLIGSTMPKDRQRLYPLCEKFEKFAAEAKDELSSALGDNGVLIMPTLPTVAYKHNESLLKSADIRFTALFNYAQLPVTHATIRLDKKHKLPFGFTLAVKPYNDTLSITVAEEIELAFGGWTPPTGVSSAISNKTPTISMSSGDVAATMTTKNQHNTKTTTENNNIPIQQSSN